MTAIDQIMAEPAAKRYADAITTAAAAQEKIDALTEAVKAAEWLRLQAESLVSAVTYPAGFPQVWDMATGEPPAEVEGLICITTGMPYHRTRDGLWRKLGIDSAMHCQWPIEDAGPFIALRDDYGLAQLARTLDKAIEDHDAIRRMIWHMPGYGEPREGHSWARPDLHTAVRRVLDAESQARAARVGEMQEQIDRLEREVADLRKQEAS